MTVLPEWFTLALVALVLAVIVWVGPVCMNPVTDEVIFSGDCAFTIVAEPKPIDWRNSLLSVDPILDEGSAEI